MAAPPSHRSTASLSQTHLAPPPPAPSPRPRRMTSPSQPPPPTPLDLPEPVSFARRPPSPLRHAITADPETGELSEDGSSFRSQESGDQPQWGDERPTSPSVAKFAANFAQRVGSLMSGMSARSSTHLPTDEELEAEAQRERERTRKEAELIMTREAQTRRLEERVLAMLDSDLRKTMTMTPPAVPSTPPPASSPKEGAGWLSAVKSKLTPTKESLTPAQQIILDTKTRDKELEKEEKKFEKEKKEIEREMKKLAKKQSKQKSGEWPSSPGEKFSDPAFINLAHQQQAPAPPQRQMTASPSSPSPMRQISMPPSLAPSPMRPTDGSASPARSGPPLYAQFNSQGALDIAATLLTIAARFEKLERWSVSHVRALEERMDDVERWLVEKEKEKEDARAHIQPQRPGEPPTSDAALSEVRDELAEVQGRIGELGREIAKMVVSPAHLSSGPSRGSAAVNRAPSTSSSVAVRSMSSSVAATPPRRQESTSPSITTPPVPSTSSRTRLPYPTGDYASPPENGLSHSAFSPPSSPPQGQTVRRVSISGLPSDSFDFSSAGNSPSGLPLSRATSPPSLPPPPERADLRRTSVSPTPRKRYTVALGGPIMAATRDRSEERPITPLSRSQSRDIGTAIFSSSPKSVAASLEFDDDSEPERNDETIGKASGRSSGFTIPDFTQSNGRLNGSSSYPEMPLPEPSQPSKRARPQSMYSGVTHGGQSIAAPKPITPLNTRLRSRSTDKFGNSASASGDESSSSAQYPSMTPNSSSRFVDPLLVRRQTKEAQANSAPAAPRVMPGKPKVPISDLVAYFNK